ncbi:membrane hypothetical protein [Desulfosarcina cetonica]|uniref:hypothetical protein n=1 Tax=Desulfosarcina cetonica TaxID=90730 RepID=UPI0012EE31F0|nr:membrane hypothetical protein [Desulfosarcina cetonica]
MNEQEKYNSPNSDHVIEIFKTLSTHVQVLDEASAAFGNAAIRPAIILNGGAVIAFLSLFGAIWGKSDLPPDIILVGRAILFWLLGLLSGSIASGFGYASQKEYASAIRANRRVLLEHIISGSGLEDFVKPSKRYLGKKRKSKIYFILTVSLVIISLSCFLAGSVVAYSSLPGSVKY